MTYKSLVVPDGITFDELLTKISIYTPNEYTWLKIDSDSAIDLNDYFNISVTGGVVSDPNKIGSFIFTNYTNGPTDYTKDQINVSSVLFTNTDTSQSILLFVRDGIDTWMRNVTSNTWLKITNEGYDVLFNKSDTPPTNTSDIWVDTSNEDFIKIKIYNTATSTWDSILDREDGMLIGTYDVNGKHVDIFDYTDSIVNTLSSWIDLLGEHIANLTVTKHLTTEEKTWYNENLLTNDELIAYISTVAMSRINEMINNAFINATDIDTNESNITQLSNDYDAHIASHITSTDVESWDDKADWDHQHPASGIVKISASAVIGGTIPISRLPKEILTQIFELNKISYFGDPSITEEDKSEKYNYSNLFFIEDPTIKWYKIVDQTKIGTPDYRDGIIEIQLSNTSMIFRNITNIPTSVLTFGIDDLYTGQTTDQIILTAEERLNTLKESDLYNDVMLSEIVLVSPIWTEVECLISKDWRSITYGGDKFIMVAYNTNEMLYSYDGIEWKSSTLPSSYLISIAYGGGTFVSISIGNNIAAYSYDGITWTQSTMPANAQWYTTLYGDNKFVAITGNNSNIAAYSYDGITWTYTTMPTSAYWYSVAYGDGKFIAVASNTNIFAYSYDGITWSQSTLPSSANWVSVVYGDGKFIAVASNTNIFAYSYDGITWSQSTLPSSALWRSVIYGDGKFVAVAYVTNIAAYSYDGITWSQSTLPSSANWVSVAYGDRKFITVASNNNITAYMEYVPKPHETIHTISASKIGFQKRVDGTEPGDMLSDSSKLDMIVLDDNDHIYKSSYVDDEYTPEFYSSDLHINMNSSDIENVLSDKYNNGHMLGLRGGIKSDDNYNYELTEYNSDRGTIFDIGEYVENGLINSTYDIGIWQEGVLPVSADWYSVTYGDGKFVAIVNFSNISAYSYDGISWTQTTMPATANWLSIAYGDGKFVAITRSTNIAAYSYDGITWTQSTLPSNLYWQRVTYGKDKFVAVVDNSNIYAYSYDGITWTQGALPVSKQWYSIIYGKDKFVVVAENTNIYAYSYDGITWTQGTLPASIQWRSVIYGDDKFVISTTSSNISAYSYDGITWAQSVLPSSSSWFSMAYGGGVYITKSYSYNIAAYSYDGITWAQSVLPVESSFNITYGGGKFVTIEYESNISACMQLEEVHNLTTNASTGLSIGITDVVFGKEANVYLTTTTNILYRSTDGVNFTTIDLGADVLRISNTCYSAGVFYLVCEYNGNYSSILKSTDGITWTNVGLSSASDMDLLNISINKYTHIRIMIKSNTLVIINEYDVAIPPLATGTDNTKLTISEINTNPVLYIFTGDSGSITYSKESNVVGNSFEVFNNDGSIMESSKDGITWDKVTSSDIIEMPVNGRWKSITYGNGKFSTIGYISNISAYSYDGITWVQSTLPMSTYWNSVTYGDGKFVAVAFDSNITAYSYDGITWTQSTLPSSVGWSSVTYGDGKFVAVPNNSNISAYSYDGITWVQSTLPMSTYWNSVTYGDGKFVAVSTVDSNISAYSYDGITWTQSTLPVSTNWVSVTYGDGKFVAVAYSSTISAYSYDGITWTQSTLPVSTSWYSVTYGDGKFVAIAGNSVTNISAYSYDGITWTQTILPVSVSWNSVTHGDGKFVAVAYSSNITAYSYDGITWSNKKLVIENIISITNSNEKALAISDTHVFSRDIDKSNGSFSPIYELSTIFSASSSMIEYINGVFIITNNNEDTLLYSFDTLVWKIFRFNSIADIVHVNWSADAFRLYEKTGSIYELSLAKKDIYNTPAWTKTTMSTSASWYSITYGDGKFVAVAYNSNISAYSYDGITWYESSLPLSTYWFSITYGDGKFVAVAYNSNISAYSYDGITWYESSLPLSTYWFSITYGDGKFVAIIRNSNISAYSYDGITWTRSTMPTSGSWYSVTYGDGKFVVITYDSNISAYSYDGITWIQSTMPTSGSWYSVTYGDGKFVVITYNNSNIAAYSYDGITWTQSTMPTSADWRSVTYGDGKFVAVVYNSNIAAYSYDGITWTQSTMPTSADWRSATYGDGKFVVITYDSNISAYLTFNDTRTDKLWSSTMITDDNVNQINQLTDEKFVFWINGNGDSIITAYKIINVITNESFVAQMPLNDARTACMEFINGAYQLIANTHLYYSYDGISWNVGSVSTIMSVDSVYYDKLRNYNDGEYIYYTTITDGDSHITIEARGYSLKDRVSKPSASSPYDTTLNSVHTSIATKDYLAVFNNNDTYARVYYGGSYSQRDLPVVDSDIHSVYYFTAIDNVVIVYESGDIVTGSVVTETWALHESAVPPFTTPKVDGKHYSNVVSYDGELYYVHNNNIVYTTYDFDNWQKIYLDECANQYIYNNGDSDYYDTMGYYNGTIYVYNNSTKQLLLNTSTRFKNSVSISSGSYEYRQDVLEWKDGELPSTAFWYDVAYGDGKFVAVASSNTIPAYSYDGITWTQSTLPVSTSWRTITYGDGKFVAVSSSNIAAYSYDGITWTQSTLPVSTSWRSVTYGDGKFVAVAYGSTISAYSYDGITWSQSTMPVSTSWRSVTYGDGKFVAVAYNSTISAYSYDGITWTQSTLPVITSWYSIAYGDGKFVAVAYNGSNIAAYSYDGITWTQFTMPLSTDWRGIAYGDGKFVAIAYNSNIAAYSYDGITWTQSTLPVTGNWWSITYGDGKFVAIAYNSNMVAYMEVIGTIETLPTMISEINGTNALMTIGSRELVLFSCSTYTPETFEWVEGSTVIAGACGVAYGNGVYVNVSAYDERASYSYDGITWTQTTMPYQQNWSSIAFVNDKFIALANDNTTRGAYSYDGITWTSMNTRITSFWHRCQYGANIYISLASDADIIYSHNGISWTASDIGIDSPDGTPSNWSGIAYGNNIFVAVTNDRDALAAYSYDGITWTQNTMPTNSSSWSGVVYGGDKFVAISASSYGAYSLNGITWTRISLPISAAWTDIAYGDGMFIANVYNSTTSAYSYDGITWNLLSISRYREWDRIAYGDGMFIITSEEVNGMVYLKTYQREQNIIQTLTVESTNKYLLNNDIVKLVDYNDIAPIFNTLNTSIVYTLYNGATNGNVSIFSAANMTLDTALYVSDTETKLITLPTSQSWSNSFYINNRFYILPSGTLYMAYSNDGIAWLSSTLPSVSKWTGLAYFKERYYAIQSGIPGLLASSLDSITWTQSVISSLSSIICTHMVHTDDMVLICSTSGKDYVYTTDMLTFTSKKFDTTISDMKMLNNSFVYTSSENNTLGISEDGIKWKVVDVDIPVSTIEFSSVLRKYVITSNTSNVYGVSDDMIIWKYYTTPDEAIPEAVSINNTNGPIFINTIDRDIHITVLKSSYTIGTMIDEAKGKAYYVGNTGTIKVLDNTAEFGLSEQVIYDSDFVAITHVIHVKDNMYIISGRDSIMIGIYKIFNNGEFSDSIIHDGFEPFGGIAYGYKKYYMISVDGTELSSYNENMEYIETVEVSGITDNIKRVDDFVFDGSHFIIRSGNTVVAWKLDPSEIYTGSIYTENESINKLEVSNMNLIATVYNNISDTNYCKQIRITDKKDRDFASLPGFVLQDVTNGMSSEEANAYFDQRFPSQYENDEDNPQWTTKGYGSMYTETIDIEKEYYPELTLKLSHIKDSSIILKVTTPTLLSHRNDTYINASEIMRNEKFDAYDKLRGN